MGLKDVIAEDVDSVFFNTEEFAEEAIIDGKSVPIIIDNDLLNGKSDVLVTGLAEDEQLILIRNKNMPNPPQTGMQMTINKKQWYVRHCLINAGILEIRIGRKQTGNR
jgi:hypothetical protein